MKSLITMKIKSLITMKIKSLITIATVVVIVYIAFAAILAICDCKETNFLGISGDFVNPIITIIMASLIIQQIKIGQDQHRETIEQHKKELQFYRDQEKKKEIAKGRTALFAIKTELEQNQMIMLNHIQCLLQAPVELSQRILVSLDAWMINACNLAEIDNPDLIQKVMYAYAILKKRNDSIENNLRTPTLEEQEQSQTIEAHAQETTQEAIAALKGELFKARYSFKKEL